MKNKKRNLSLLLAAGLTIFPAIALLSTSTVTARADLKDDIVKEVTDPSTVPVSSVTLDKHELTLTCGSAETLTASILPQDATNKLITWSSTNPLIAAPKSVFSPDPCRERLPSQPGLRKAPATPALCTSKNCHRRR